MANHAIQPGTHSLADRGSDCIRRHLAPCARCSRRIAAVRYMGARGRARRNRQRAARRRSFGHRERHCRPRFRAAFRRRFSRANQDARRLRVHRHQSTVQDRRSVYRARAGPVPEGNRSGTVGIAQSVRRTEILEHRGLARLHVFRNRLPMMHRDGWAGPRASSATAYAWFVWERDHTGPIIVDRISHDSQKVKHTAANRERRRRGGAQQQHPKQMTLGFCETTERSS